MEDKKNQIRLIYVFVNVHCVYVTSLIFDVIGCFNTTEINNKVAEWRSGKGVGFRTKGSLVQTPACAHFVVALSKSHLPCLVLVEPRKRWTDDRLGQTVTRLEITLCLMC